MKEKISREPTLLVVVVGVPNVGKSALINSIHQIALSRFPGKIFHFLTMCIGKRYKPPLRQLTSSVWEDTPNVRF